MKSANCKLKTLSVGFLVLFVAGCGEKVEREGNFTVLDDRGVKVAFSRTPERAVSLVPSVTEVIFALGAEAELVGVTTFCNHPPQASEKPKVGDFSNPSLERIVALKPEVVFATMPEQTLVIRRLEDLRLRVFSLQPESVEGTLRSMEKLGAIFKRQARADSLVNQLRKELASISGELSHVERRRVYVEIASNPLMAATENSFVGELVGLAGGTNIAKGPKPYIVVNSERIIRANPQVIVITHPVSTVEEVKARIGWQRITAVREDGICRVNPDLVLRPGPRIVKGVVELLEAIHPEAARGLGSEKGGPEM